MQAFTVDNRVKSAGEFFSMVLEAEQDAAPSATGTVPHLGGFCHRSPFTGRNEGLSICAHSHKHSRRYEKCAWSKMFESKISHFEKLNDLQACNARR